MAQIEAFIEGLDFIRFRFVKPLFYCISVLLTTFLSPFLGEAYYYEFTKPEETVYVGETMEITEEYKIVIGENASSVEKNAAEKLKYYLNEISDINLLVVNDSTAESDKEIVIGKTNREGEDFTIDRTDLGDDGVVIKTAGEKIVLSGAEQRGAIYSVYTFLEEYFDCHWFTYDLTVIPKSEKLEIPKEIDYTYVPKLTYRSTDWISPSKSNEYKVANGLNSNVYGYMSDDFGGGISYAGGFCHTFAALIDRNLINTEPEIFALGVKSGERTTDQWCLTNPRTLELAIKGVRNWLAANPNATIVSVTQNDNSNYCVCDNCKAIDEEEGSHSGTMIRFVNAIADNIKDDYPNVMVDTFAYAYTRTPPKITTVRDNVIVRLCSFECTFSSPIEDGLTEVNKGFAEDIAQWSKIAKNLHIWDYTTNYNHYLAPFGNFDVLQDNLQFFVENNVIGVYEEGNYQAAISDGEFAELRCYMLAKLMWNPYCDVDELIYDFCEAYYGDGYQNIIDFINFIDKNSGGFALDANNWWITPIPTEIETTDGMGIYTDIISTATLNVGLTDVKKIDKLWEDAKNAAQTDWQKENIEKSEICWRYWKACLSRGEFSAFNPNIEDEYKKLYEDFQQYGITRLQEAFDMAMPDNPDLTLPPYKWMVDLEDLI